MAYTIQDFFPLFEFKAGKTSDNNSQWLFNKSMRAASDKSGLRWGDPNTWNSEPLADQYWEILKHQPNAGGSGQGYLRTIGYCDGYGNIDDYHKTDYEKLVFQSGTEYDITGDGGYDYSHWLMDWVPEDRWYKIVSWYRRVKPDGTNFRYVFHINWVNPLGYLETITNPDWAGPGSGTRLCLRKDEVYWEVSVDPATGKCTDPTGTWFVGNGNQVVGAGPWGTLYDVNGNPVEVPDATGLFGWRKAYWAYGDASGQKFDSNCPTTGLYQNLHTVWWWN